jgi:hypothetical protein
MAKEKGERGAFLKDDRQTIDEETVVVRRADIGVISAFKLAAVLLAVLMPLGGAFWYVLHGEIERAVLMNNAIMAERYVTKIEQQESQARIQKRLDEIQSQLEQQRRLTEKVAVRLKVDL